MIKNKCWGREIEYCEELDSIMREEILKASQFSYFTCYFPYNTHEYRAIPEHTAMERKFNRHRKKCLICIKIKEEDEKRTKMYPLQS